jgi:hypothetical protein
VKDYTVVLKRQVVWVGSVISTNPLTAASATLPEMLSINTDKKKLINILKYSKPLLIHNPLLKLLFNPDFFVSAIITV